jgi:tetratricopeptide (TPR) repeat protein
LGEAAVLNTVANTYFNQRLFVKAAAHFEQMLTIYREVKDRRWEGLVLFSLGNTTGNLNQPDKAIEYYEQSLAILREVKDRSFEARVLLSLGNVWFNRGQPQKAIESTEEAQVLLHIGGSKRKTGQPTEAAAFITESVDLNRIIGNKGQEVTPLVDAALLERERSLSRQLNDKAQLLLQVGNAEQAAALKREISQLETDYERAQAAIRKASPRYAALTQPQPLKLGEIQAQLDANTLLLEYALGEQRSYLWTITKDSLMSYELPKGEVIEKDARLVHELLSARSTTKRGESFLQRQQRISQAEARLPAAAAALSQTLLAPVAAQLGNKRLVIVADGALQYIPFAMLPHPAAGKNQPLIVAPAGAVFLHRL